MGRFENIYNLSLIVNEAEKVIIAEVERQLELEENVEMCKCQDCVLDIIALALNKVPPAYRSTFTGVIYAQKLSSGDYIELYSSAVSEAIKKVKNNPSHD